MKCHPNGDRTLLPGAKAVKQKNYTVSITVSEAGWRLLGAIAANEDRTVEGLVLGKLVASIRGLARVWADEETSALTDLFTPEKEEA